MRRTLLVILATVTLLAGWLAAGELSGAVAQGNFTIRVYACERNPGSVGIAAEDPEECWRVDGVAVSVAAPDGTEIAACITKAGECNVLVPAPFEEVVVTEDVATLPAGYQPRKNPIATRAYSEFAGAIFVNLPSAQLEGDATLTIHNRRCPLEYAETDFYGACHDNPIPDMPFFLTGRTTRNAETAANGNVTFADLPSGAYEISGGPTGDFVRNAMYCAPASAPGTPFPFTQTDNTTIALDLTGADNVICDWFSVPEYRGTGPAPTPAASPIGARDETLTVSSTLCPEGYRGSDYVQDCSTAAAGMEVLLQDTDTGAQLPAGGGFTVADENGFVRFELGSLAPGRVILRAIPDADDVAGGFTIPRLSCKDDAGNEVPAAQPPDTRAAGLMAEVGIARGAQVRCDVSFLPLAPA